MSEKGNMCICVYVYVCMCEYDCMYNGPLCSSTMQRMALKALALSSFFLKMDPS